MTDVLVFDIETIPQQTLTPVQQQELDKKVNSYLSKNYINTKPTEEDIEKAKNLIQATSPFFGEIVCIGLFRNNGVKEGSFAITDGSEKLILERFWNILSKVDGLFVSFNGLEFDVPFILKRSMKYRLVPTNINFLDTRRYSKFPHFDVRLILGDFDKFASCSLKLLCDHLGISNPKEGEVHAENLYSAYKAGQIDEIAKYCVRDVESTYECYNVVKKYTYQRNR